MRYIGIDIGKAKHAIAIVETSGEIKLKAKTFKENKEGYDKLRGWIGEPEDAVVGLEATGHYWKNLAASLLCWGFGVVLINPLRTRRFAEEDMLRAKTDAVDALSIARFLSEKRPAASRVPDELTAELRELVHLRDRLLQDLGDRVRQLHRAVDLVFPEFTLFVKDLSSGKATKLLSTYPTAKAFAAAGVRELGNLKYGSRHTIGRKLAKDIVDRAKCSVGAHHGEPYQLQVGYFCEDIDTLRARLKRLEARIDAVVEKHDIAGLLTTIGGIGPTTAARLIATLGDPADFASPGALGAFVGVVPGIRHSGKRTPARARCSPFGAAKLRHKLWMPTMVAVRKNPYLKHHYDALIARGKQPKVALIACMRRLLGLVYAVAKRRSPFVPILPKSA